MYLAFVRREAVKSMTLSRNAIVTGIWSNSSFDSSENRNARQDALREIDEQWEVAVQKIYGNDPEEQDLSASPFFAAMKVPELPSEFSEQDVKAVEQAAERAELLSTIDQS